MPEPANRPAPPTRRADAERNRAHLLAAARAAFADSEADVSMAEIARRAGVGMATLYRNFPSRHDLLEALYTEEVDAVCAAAQNPRGETPGAELEAWLRRFLTFSASKREIASELLTQPDSPAPVFGESRARVIAAGAPLLAAAQDAGEIRDDISLEQILDTLVAMARIRGDAGYLAPILRTFFEGLRPG